MRVFHYYRISVFSPLPEPALKLLSGVSWGDAEPNQSTFTAELVTAMA